MVDSEDLEFKPTKVAPFLITQQLFLKNVLNKMANPNRFPQFCGFRLWIILAPLFINEEYTLALGSKVLVETVTQNTLDKAPKPPVSRVRRGFNGTKSSKSRRVPAALQNASHREAAKPMSKLHDCSFDPGNKSKIGLFSKRNVTKTPAARQRGKTICTVGDCSRRASYGLRPTRQQNVMLTA